MEALNNDQKDALTEMVSIGMGRAAHVINQMLSSRVTLAVPEVEFSDFKTLSNKIDWHSSMSAVQMRFSGDFQGNCSILFPPQSAANLVTALVEEEEGSGDTLDAIRHSTLTEVGNIVLNSVLGSLTNYMKKRVEYSIPEYYEGELGEVISQNRGEEEVSTLMARTQFQVKDLEIKGDILMIFTLNSMKSIIAQVDSILEN